MTNQRIHIAVQCAPRACFALACDNVKGRERRALALLCHHDSLHHRSGTIELCKKEKLLLTCLHGRDDSRSLCTQKQPGGWQGYSIVFEAEMVSLLDSDDRCSISSVASAHVLWQMHVVASEKYASCCPCSRSQCYIYSYIFGVTYWGPIEGQHTICCLRQSNAKSKQSWGSTWGSNKTKLRTMSIVPVSCISSSTTSKPDDTKPKQITISPLFTEAQSQK